MTRDDSTAAVLVAAGRGTRAGPGLPKQWRDLGGRTVAAHTISTFRAAPEIDRLALVLNAADMPLAAGWEAHGDIVCVEGGETRSASVRAGLETLSASPPRDVLIHDIARPLVSERLISRVKMALKDAVAAAPALAVTDALWRGRDDTVLGTEDRTGLYRAQTPQGFRFAEILAAHRAWAETDSGQAADDVQIARAAGMEVRIVPGDERNIKLTGPEDFARAEALLKGVAMDVRCGNGFDVHAFAPGNYVTLCGLDIPHDRALTGHSDADVAMHAVTDAIYGALAEGDIGRHFPPSDPQWKGAASEIFLAHAAERIAARGYGIGNLDLTLICERPAIAPHADAMIDNLAAILRTARGRISVKATTSERLGFAGREEGIAAIATVTLVGA